MKNLRFLFVISLLTVFFLSTAQAQNKGKTTTTTKKTTAVKKTTPAKTTAPVVIPTILKAGTKLIYSLNYNGTICTFTVEIKTLYPEVQYAWDITPPISTKGKTKILKSALDNSLILNSDFNIDNAVYTDQTALWVSKKICSFLKSKKPVTINTGKGNSVLTFSSTEKKSYKVNNEMKELTVINAKTDKAINFTILDDPNPIILRQTLRFNIELKEIIIP
ncbi:MAG: hypothetical protein V2A54_10115 [Bacteroidota bacterium]